MSHVQTQLPPTSSLPFFHWMEVGSTAWYSSQVCIADLTFAFETVGHSLRTKYVVHWTPWCLLFQCIAQICLVVNWSVKAEHVDGSCSVILSCLFGMQVCLSGRFLSGVIRFTSIPKPYSSISCRKVDYFLHTIILLVAFVLNQTSHIRVCQPVVHALWIGVKVYHLDSQL